MRKLRLLKIYLFFYQYKRIRIEYLAYNYAIKLLSDVKQQLVSVSPNYNDNLQKFYPYKNSPIYIYHLQNVICNINTAGFVNKDNTNIQIEKFPLTEEGIEDFTSPLICMNYQKSAYIKNFDISSSQQFDKVLFLGGNGSFNFYHWLIEIAPKLLLIDNSLLLQYGITEFVANKVVQNNANFKYILEVLTQHLNIKLHYLDTDEKFFVKDLYYINAFNLTIYNYIDLPKVYKPSTIFNKILLDKLKSKFLKLKNSNKKINESKIYILRNEQSVSDYNKRSYNEREIFEFFETQGFIGVYPDKLSIVEQIDLFGNATFIVGPSGAAWTNLLFCQAGTKAISWLPQQLQNFDTFSSLANLYEVDMRFIKYATKNKNFHSSYQLALTEVINLYNLMN